MPWLKDGVCFTVIRPGIAKQKGYIQYKSPMNGVMTIPNNIQFDVWPWHTWYIPPKRVVPFFAGINMDSHGKISSNFLGLSWSIWDSSGTIYKFFNKRKKTFQTWDVQILENYSSTSCSFKKLDVKYNHQFRILGVWHFDLHPPWAGNSTETARRVGGDK